MPLQTKTVSHPLLIGESADKFPLHPYRVTGYRRPQHAVGSSLALPAPLDLSATRTADNPRAPDGARGYRPILDRLPLYQSVFAQAATCMTSSALIGRLTSTRVPIPGY